MGNWSKKFSKVLTAAGISAIIAVSSIALPIEAFAARTVTDNVMIRNEPSTEGGIIGSLNEGDEVTILDVMQSGDGYPWYYIQLENGATGYVRSDLIEADDSELAAFRDNGQEETQAEEPEAAEEEEPAEETAGTEEAAPEEPESTPAQEETAPANTGTEGYDATKDPNANFRAGYEQEADGTVTWYVYNDDNGSKVRISDLQAQENAAEAGKGGSGIWRTLAIIFGILAAALVAFVVFLLKQIRDGRSKTTRGRALDAAAAARDAEEEEEFFFEDDEPEEESIEDEETDAEETEDEITGDNDEDAEAAKDPVSDDDQTVMADSTITREVPAEAEPTEIPAEEIEAAIAATTAQLKENISKDEAEAAEEAAANEVIEEEPEGGAKEEFAEDAEEEAEDESGDYEEDDYEEEEYDDYEEDEDAESEEFDDEDEEYEDEDYEDEEESESRTARRSAAKGGFFGFLKKMFGSDSDEDAEDPDDGGDFDDYDDESDDHEFDEFKEYPEDIDLLPREEADDSDYLEDNDYSDEDAGQDDGERGRLSMQRVMKNVSYKEEESDFYREGDPNDLSDSLFEDDDDMEYSFISSRKK